LRAAHQQVTTLARLRRKNESRGDPNRKFRLESSNANLWSYDRLYN
jgi:hypothetical protein